MVKWKTFPAIFSHLVRLLLLKDWKTIRQKMTIYTFCSIWLNVLFAIFIKSLILKCHLKILMLFLSDWILHTAVKSKNWKLKKLLFDMAESFFCLMYSKLTNRGILPFENSLESTHSPTESILWYFITQIL